MLEAEWRICSSEISLQSADMPTCSNSVTFQIDFDFAAAAIASVFVHKKTFLVFHILEIYKSLLPKDVSENYQSTRLQCKLARKLSCVQKGHH
jgi:hypothetical protein